MPERRVLRVERDVIVPLRKRVLGVRTVSGDLSPSTRHWAVLSGERVVGCASVVAIRGHALRAMAVAPDHQRRGVGAQLLRVLCSEIDAPLWCNARLEAVPFYLHMGWVEVGPRFDLQQQGSHQRMTYG